MLHISVYQSLWTKVSVNQHHTGNTVDIDFGPKEGEKLGYLNLSADHAEQLAADLLAAARLARSSSPLDVGRVRVDP